MTQPSAGQEAKKRASAAEQTGAREMEKSGPPKASKSGKTRVRHGQATSKIQRNYQQKKVKRDAVPGRKK